VAFEGELLVIRLKVIKYKVTERVISLQGFKKLKALAFEEGTETDRSVYGVKTRDK